MAATDSIALNMSNNIITTKQIEGLLALFEGDGAFEFWFANVCNPSLGPAEKEVLRRNFPRKNYLRELIMKLAMSVPIPTIQGNRDEECLSLAERERIDERLKEMVNTREWEGDNNFNAALLWWRCYCFVTGDIFVKLPAEACEDEDEPTESGLCCYPERMPAQRTYIKMDPDIRKKIDGFRFQYYVGSGQYTEQGDLANLVTEYITRGSWTIEQPSGEVEEFDTDDILCVSHLAWEEREAAPRGLPLALRLADKILHLYSITMDRRLGNKMGSVPMYKVLNATGDVPAIAPGAIWSLKTEVPWAAADVQALATNFDDQSLQREYVDAKRELYAEAFLPFEDDKNGGTGGPGVKSGKAIEMLSKDQVNYREAYQTKETSFLQDLFSKALKREGLECDPDDIQVKYPALVAPDNADRLAEANFWLEKGMDEKGLEVMGIDEDEIDDMLAKVEDKRAEQMLGSPQGNAKVKLGPDGKPMMGPDGKPVMDEDDGEDELEK